MKLEEAIKYLRDYAVKNNLDPNKATFEDIKNLYDANK